MTVLLLLALHLARLKHLSFQAGLAVVEAIESIPSLIREVLRTEPLIEDAARLVAKARSALYLGRDVHYPVALEGALKLKEISYIHAEGYPTAEMKHGPIALVDEFTPCVFVAPEGSLHAKTLSNLEEVRARHAPIIAVGTRGDRSLESLPHRSSCRSRTPPRSFSPSWPSSPCSCSPTTSRFSSARISTSRATWPRA